MFLVDLWHSFDHFGTHFAHDLTVYHTGKVAGKYVLESVFLISHLAKDVVIQNIRHDIRFQTPGINYFFIVLADIFEHILDAVADLKGIVDL